MRTVLAHEDIVRTVKTNASLEHHPESVDGGVVMEIVLTTILFHDLHHALDQRAVCEPNEALAAIHAFWF
jgi:hypothetical protein